MEKTGSSLQQRFLETDLGGRNGLWRWLKNIPRVYLEAPRGRLFGSDNLLGMLSFDCQCDIDAETRSMDCDEDNVTVYPSITEALNTEEDNDCDEMGFCDDDRDDDPTTYPGGTEACDDCDDNCDASVAEASFESWYMGTDGDGNGDNDA